VGIHGLGGVPKMLLFLARSLHTTLNLCRRKPTSYDVACAPYQTAFQPVGLIERAVHHCLNPRSSLWGRPRAVEVFRMRKLFHRISVVAWGSVNPAHYRAGNSSRLPTRYRIPVNLLPIGLPRPVQASQPGRAVKPSLLPSVMSWKLPGFA